MTAPSLLDELEEVVRLFGKLPDAGRVSFAMYGDAMRAEMAASTFIRTHHAEIADMAKRLEAAERDAAYGRALIDAMNCEYQAVKESRKGGRQEPWITTYILLRRLKSAADHMADTGNPATEQDQQLAATQEGEG